MRSERAACSSQHPIVVRVVLVGKDGVHGMVRDSGRALCLEEDEEEKAQYLVNEVHVPGLLLFRRLRSKIILLFSV